jgi:hypothetical protein
LNGIALKNKQSEFYDKDEAERRFEAALRGARIAGHKPMTDVPKKRGVAGQIGKNTSNIAD